MWGLGVDVFCDVGGWFFCVGVEVDVNGGGECFGVEFMDESFCVDFGGWVGYEVGDVGVLDEGEGVLDVGLKEWMEFGERIGS